MASSASLTDPPQDGSPAASPSGRHSDVWYNETVAFLGLAAVSGVGYWTLFHVKKAGLTFLDLLRWDSRERFIGLLKQHGAKTVRELPEDWSEAQRWIWGIGRRNYDQLRARGIQVLHNDQAGFPDRLRKIEDAPQWLFCEGDISLLSRDGFALVGTRKPTPDGEFLTKYLVALLHEFHLTTISGLAEGIDKLAHEYSLRFEIPTIAILGTGILQDFPAESSPLRRAIIEKGGLVISEYLPTQMYSRENFVRRNRIQAGLAKAVVPLEWRAKSGTAHTVRFAAEQGRPIVSLRLVDWAKADHDEVEVARGLGASVFTVPGEEAQLKDHLGFLLGSADHFSTQLTLDMFSAG